MKEIQQQIEVLNHKLDHLDHTVMALLSQIQVLHQEKELILNYLETALPLSELYTAPSQGSGNFFPTMEILPDHGPKKKKIRGENTSQGHGDSLDFSPQNPPYHKDILLDDLVVYPTAPNYVNNQSLEVQNNRLTAQLTAAYQRIASLEEQLLSKKMPQKTPRHVNF